MAPTDLSELRICGERMLPAYFSRHPAANVFAGNMFGKMPNGARKMRALTR
jgi:hypothetical protein